MALSATPGVPAVLTVAALTRLVRDMLADAFPAVWVKGELSGIRRSERGHVYFTLKDRLACLECVLYESAARRVGFELRDGAEVEAFGGITVYEPRGRYQLTVEELRLGGAGALLLELERLKRRLQAEGLFDSARKRPLPLYPRRIGLVTSPTGAAVRDLVKVLRARWPGIGLVLAPVRVQGPGAAEEIAAAIERFGRYGRVDLLIIGRGGGSLEDLWAFNQERVVRAVAASRIPVISAVGHEVDVTLADLAADVRAATPSNAGEIAVRDRTDVLRRVRLLATRLERASRQAVVERRRGLDRLLAKYGFRRQRDAFGMWRQRVDELLEALRLRVRTGLEQARRRLERTRARYGLRNLPASLARRRQAAVAIAARLQTAVSRALAARRVRLARGEDRLRALSPRLVLERGYCLVRRADGRLARVAADLAVGDPVQLEFARGEADARVEGIRPGARNGE
jgi:exodeoxyribonuclease VII large subunit